ncbi:hypothetical protein DVK00_02840 [Haloarcula sp. Atlit-47R]|uniref:hypothetical protein n=1 Tax=Haloarcula sp. Atlit-47R TaxID=2282132 RepID=UPI000EF23DCB|nr:hypothetical protein [Haloarcula sp. Atlit-47R]RLM47461.1 hypothetical protein DVK00_02840 [Haloarcula sp. Atlit-47R]
MSVEQDIMDAYGASAQQQAAQQQQQQSSGGFNADAVISMEKGDIEFWLLVVQTAALVYIAYNL